LQAAFFSLASGFEPNVPQEIPFMTPLIVKSPKPRNPLVAAAHFRRAGKHGAQAGAQRQADRQSLKRELNRLELPRDVRGKPPGP
jgi:hypothetical protein